MKERGGNNHEFRGPSEHEPAPEALFDLGQIVITQGASEALKQDKRHPVQLIARHVEGDWGTLPEDDFQQNELALKEGHRLFSAYSFEEGNKYYVITEWDRSITTVLLPEEY